MLATYNVKGISAAVYVPGKKMWKGVSGESYAGVPMDTSMLLSIGSITKTLVASEIFKLIEAGQLSLSDTVGALLPPITNVNTGITISQLLSHTSGMGDYLNSAWQTAMFSDLNALWYYPSALTAFCSPATGGPGSPWNYCNANYSLLGMIIEAKKSDSLHRVLRNDFINPFNLNNTHMEAFESYTNPIPHNWTTPTLNPALATDASGTPHNALWSSVEPAGGYFADAADIAKWGYNLYSGKVISPSSLTSMLSFIPVSSSYFNGYGMGSMRFVANGRTYYGHGGNYFGYAASMLYYPKDSICVAVLINQDCIATYEARSLMNVLINKLATVDINEAVLDNKVTIDPNPAHKQLSIHVPGNNTPVQIVITDVAGRTVYEANMNTRNIAVNTANFSAGAYFIKIITDRQTVVKQVVVKH